MYVKCYARGHIHGEWLGSPVKKQYLCVKANKMKTYRVIIAGSRKFNDYGKLKENCDRILSAELEDEDCKVVIVSGHAKGADSIGEQYARERGLDIDAHPADWKKYGRAAGVMRNKEMAETADALIAFPQEGEGNRGTRNMVRLAREKGLRCEVVE